MPLLCLAVDPITRFEGEFTFFSNKFDHTMPFAITVGALVVSAKNSEALFQCQKVPSLASTRVDLGFWAAKRPGAQGKMDKGTPRRWQSGERIHAVMRAIRAKFALTSTTGVLALKLLATGTAKLIFVNDHNYTYWGVNKHRKCETN